MNIIKIDSNSIKNSELLVNKSDLYACCFGSFDGFHVGHQLLIDKVLKTGNKYKKACFFFSFPFNTYVNRNSSKKVLMSIDDKINYLNSFNFDTIFILNLNESSISITKDEFINNFIIRNNIKEVVVGQDFTFGYKKEGTTNSLLTHKEFNTSVIPLIEYDNKKISTTYIKHLLLLGQIKLANKLLKRFYSIKGKVEHGLQNGTKIGFKTINLQLSTNYLVPKQGVYATLVKIKDNKNLEKTYLGMTNIGLHPTIDILEDISIETHIIDFDLDIYDMNVELYFIDYLRDEVKFDSIESLKKQLQINKDYVKNNFSYLLKNKGDCYND